MEKQMKILMKQVEACLRDLDALGIPCGNVRRWEINTRAMARWGMCRCVGSGAYHISIAQVLLEDGVEKQALKDTIVHELLHTVPGCFDHQGKWKEYAELVNKRLPQYTIKRTATRKEKGIQEPEYRYLIRCRNCGAEFSRLRESKLVRDPQKYRCGRCRGILERVV